MKPRDFFVVIISEGGERVTDEKIVELFFQRDEAAIESLDTKYGKRLRCFGDRITSDPHTTEECVDDTYMKTWETVPPENPRNYLYGYLAKIMRNLCLDRLKFENRKKRSAAITTLSSELSEAAPSPDRADSEALRGELASIITKFVLNLPEEARQIFTLRYFYMEELSSISKKMFITEGKVKTVLKRTRDKLKIYLEAYGYSV